MVQPGLVSLDFFVCFSTANSSLKVILGSERSSQVNGYHRYKSMERHCPCKLNDNDIAAVFPLKSTFTAFLMLMMPVSTIDDYQSSILCGHMRIDCQFSEPSSFAISPY